MNLSKVIFLSGPLESVPWLAQQVIITVAFVVLCRAGGKLGKREFWGHVLFEGGVLLFVLTLGSLVLMAWNSTVFVPLWCGFQGIVLAVYLYKGSSYRVTVKITMWCSMYAGMQALIMAAGQVSYLAGYYISRGVPEAAARLLVYLLIIALAVYLRAFNFDEFDEIPSRGMFMIYVCDIMMLLFSLLDTEKNWANVNVETVLRILLAYLSFFIIAIVAIYALYMICKEQEAANLLREQQQQLLADRERFTMAEQQIQEIRSIRHDLKNQRNYMRILLEEERYEELKNYLDTDQRPFDQRKVYVKCGNNSVNVILNMEFAKVGPGIQLEHLLVVPPVLPMKDDELCSILTNLLDNAVEECTRLQAAGREDLSIRLEIYPQSNFLYILCQNTTDRTHLDHWKDGLRSTKEDKSLHGYGTQIVAKLAEKYGGCAEYSLGEGCFAAKVLLDMMGEEIHD